MHLRVLLTIGRRKNTKATSQLFSHLFSQVVFTFFATRDCFCKANVTAVFRYHPFKEEY